MYSLVELKTHAALPRCMAAESFWRRKSDSRGSPLTWLMRAPIAVTRSWPSEHNAPMLSKAIGTKRWEFPSSAYFLVFFFAAASAAQPWVWTVLSKCDGANVSATVTSHARALPDFQGTIDMPSGRFLSRLEVSDGFLIDGTPAADKDLWMMSLIIWCRAIFPSADKHERPCLPIRSTTLPLTHGCSSHRGKPRRRPTAILITSLLRRRPHEVTG